MGENLLLLKYLIYKRYALNNSTHFKIKFSLILFLVLVATVGFLFIPMYSRFNSLISSQSSQYRGFITSIVNYSLEIMLFYYLLIVVTTFIIFLICFFPLNNIFNKITRYVYQISGYGDINLEDNIEYVNRFYEKSSLVGLLAFLFIAFVLYTLTHAGTHPLTSLIVAFIIMTPVMMYAIRLGRDLPLKMNLISENQKARIIDTTILSLYLWTIYLIICADIIFRWINYITHHSYSIYWSNYLNNIQKIYYSYSTSSIPPHIKISDFASIQNTFYAYQIEIPNTLNLALYSLVLFPTLYWMLFYSEYSGVKRLCIASSFFILGALIPRFLSIWLFGQPVDIMIFFGLTFSGISTFTISFLKVVIKRYDSVRCPKCNSYYAPSFSYCPHCGKKTNE